MASGNASTAENTRQPIYTFDKNARERVCASLTEFKGNTYIDLRVFIEKADGEMCPTRKGLTLSPTLLDELGEAVDRLRGAAKEAGLI